MLEELFNLVKQAAQDKVINNPDIPNEKNNEIVGEATDTVASGLRNIVAGGGAESLLSLFGNKNQGFDLNSLKSNPIVSMMIGYFTNKLMNKHNMSGDQASNIAGSLIPDALKGLVNKIHDPSDGGFSLDGLLKSITGGKSEEVAQQHGGGLQDILGKLSGGGSNGGGLMDIVSQLAGGARDQQQKNGGGGGLMDVIKGFMK